MGPSAVDEHIARFDIADDASRTRVRERIADVGDVADSGISWQRLTLADERRQVPEAVSSTSEGRDDDASPCAKSASLQTGNRCDNVATGSRLTLYMEFTMPKYLLKVTYTAEGARGLLKDGGTKRRAAAQRMVESLGGRLETLYFAFGSCDVFAIADLPDATSAAAASIALSASGRVTCEAVVLLTAEEIDAAVKKSPSYTAPGQ
jgi:uncharacterized protein with GYD domain